MFRIRFGVVTRSSMIMRIESSSSVFEFIFTDAAGNPIPLLIDDLICLKKSLQLERTISFLEEPDFVEIKLSKCSEDKVNLVVLRQNSPPELSYTTDCDSILLAFWRGLRLLEETLLQENYTWSHGIGDMFKNLPVLRDLK